VTAGDFGGRVRAYLLANPQVLDEVVAARQANEDNARVAQINQAAAANPALLATDARDPAVGPADAKLTVTEFFDYRCPGCQAVSRDYLALLRSHPAVRFLLQPWPTLQQAGVAEVDASNWTALFAPKGTPAAVIDKLNAEVVRILSLPDIKERFAGGGVEVMPSTAAQLAARVKKEAGIYKTLVQKANIKPD